MDHTAESKDPSPIGCDFAIYYTAGQMVIDGETDQLFNNGAFHSKINLVLGREVDSLLGWPYPPSFLLYILPFSIFPYHLGLILWLTTTLGLAIWAIYLLTCRHKKVFFLALGFPGLLMNLVWGQTAFLNTALIGFGLYWLKRKPIYSGLMFGLLTYKPQIAVYPIVFLLLSRNWLVFGWSVLWIGVVSFISWLIFGTSVWLDFVHNLFASSPGLLTDSWQLLSAVQPTLYSVGRIFGFRMESIILATVILAIVATGFLLRVWRNTDRLNLKWATFVLALLLSIPYYMQYDLMLLSIPLVLLTSDYLDHGFSPPEFVVLCVLWIMPLINWPLVSITGIQICPFVIILVFGMTVVRALKVGLPTQANKGAIGV